MSSDAILDKYIRFPPPIDGFQHSPVPFLPYFAYWSFPLFLITSLQWSVYVYIHNHDRICIASVFPPFLQTLYSVIN